MTVTAQDVDVDQGTTSGSLGDMAESPELHGFLTTPNAVDGGNADENTVLQFEEATSWDMRGQGVEATNLKPILSAYLQPTLDYPSDKIVFRTVTMNNNDGVNGPTLLVNRQVDGMACRCRVRNTGAAGVVWLLTDNNDAVPSASPTQVYSQGFALAVGAELALTTRNAIWAVSSGAPGTTQVSVTIETYTCE